MRASSPVLLGSLITIVALAGLGACGHGTGTTGTMGGTTDSLRTARTQIVAAINQDRATLSLPALTESTATEACADTQAATDAAGDSTHSTFGHCGEYAQNECPGWATLGQLATGCIPLMWQEGPGGGNYINMTNTRYTRVTVGIAIASSGLMWSVIDFAP